MQAKQLERVGPYQWDIPEAQEQVARDSSARGCVPCEWANHGMSSSLLLRKPSNEHFIRSNKDIPSTAKHRSILTLPSSPHRRTLTADTELRGNETNTSNVFNSILLNSTLIRRINHLLLVCRLFRLKERKPLLFLAMCLSFGLHLRFEICPERKVAQMPVRRRHAICSLTIGLINCLQLINVSFKTAKTLPTITLYRLYSTSNN